MEIKKLADIAEWADSIIRVAGYNEEKYKSDAATAYCNVKAYELWRIRDVALESIERHSVYTNALNADIVAKESKIDLMQKELDGRKAGYAALKARMDSVKKELEDTKEALDKTIEGWVPLNAHDKVVDDLKDAIKERDKTIMEKNETINTANDAIVKLRKELADCKVKIRHQKENLDGINKTLEIKTKENERLIAVKKNQQKEIEGHEAENARLSEKILELKKERDKHMARVSDLRMELDCVKASKEKHEEAARDKTIEDLRESNGYLRTQCLARNTEIETLKTQVKNLEKELDKTCKEMETDLKNHNKRDMTLVDELAGKNDEIKGLKEENSYLKSEIKQKQNIIKRAYERYSDEVIKTRKDILEVAYRDIEKDNGYVGFKLYVKNALIEAKGDKNEANEIITGAVKSAYSEWDKTQKENEKTIKKAIKEVMNKKYGYAGEIAFRIRSEVDKKRIVDIGEGAEKILGVSRELFDAAIKALVDDGYQEIIGRIPQATNSYVYMDMHVLATPDVEIKETANAESIKSLDFDIPCGSDSIE